MLKGRPSGQLLRPAHGIARGVHANDAEGNEDHVRQRLPESWNKKRTLCLNRGSFAVRMRFEAQPRPSSKPKPEERPHGPRRHAQADRVPPASQRRSTWQLLERTLEERIDCCRKTGRSLTFFDQCKASPNAGATIPKSPSPV